MPARPALGADAVPVNAPLTDMARLLRAARRARVMSQRDLAALADVPRSTIDRIEAGRVKPRIETVVHLLNVLGFHLTVSDDAGRSLVLDDDHDGLRDAAGRRFPAHLRWSKTPGWYDSGGYWWGWCRICWPFGTGAEPPEYTYWHRHVRWPRPLDPDWVPDGLGLDEGVEPG